MNYSNYRFTLDIQSNLSQVSLPVKLNDTGRKLLIGLTDGGNPYAISEGSMAKFTYKKAEPNADGVYEADIYDCILEDNYSTIRFDLTTAVTNLAGVVDCEIRLYGPNGRLLTSPRFILVVDERVVYDDDIPLSEEQASTIEGIILTEAARVQAENARADAEVAREEAEAERASASQIAVDNANTATDNANTATDNANTAADNAQSVADELLQKLETGDYDGIPCTHYWDGTTLHVSSASGESSADLKGKDGYIPVRGTDYWTDADKAEIKSYVDDAILNGAW